MIKPKKIVIDARMYGLEHAGIGRYVMNLVGELRNLKTKEHKDTCEVAESDSDSSEVEGKEKITELHLLIRKGKLDEIKREVGDTFKLVIAEAPHYSLKEQIILPILLFKLRPDLVHFPHFNVPVLWWGKQVVTIHDLIKHESRGAKTTTQWRPFYWFKYLNYLFLVWLAIKRAAKIIVPSKWWKKELVERYKLPRSKVVVTYEDVDKKFLTARILSRKPQGILNKYKIKKPYIIYVGNLYPHKNVERLVEAAKRINTVDSDTPAYRTKERLSLVIACSRNVFYQRFKEKVKRMGAKGLVNLIGFVEDGKELSTLFNQAKAFVFPSLIEGFGLPGLEAMACGCPVVASDIPVLREIYGNAALYFDPLEVSDIAEKIRKVMNNRGLRDELIKEGFEQVKKYSWRKMARETLGVYFSVLN